MTTDTITLPRYVVEALLRESQAVADDHHTPRYVRLDEAIAELTAAIEAAKQERKQERDWKEDFAHENGEYQNICCDCGHTFVGHKRRPICKTCFTAKEREAEPVAWAIALGDFAHIQMGAKRPEYPVRYEIPLFTTTQPQVQEWKPIDTPLYYKTRCADGTTFLNAVQMPAHAVEWCIAAAPKKEGE